MRRISAFVAHVRQRREGKEDDSRMGEFIGFEQSNTTPVPDVFFDEFLSLLNGSELKAMLYIFRRTLGFKKTTDAISLNQFQHGIITKDGRVLDKGCGIKDRKTLCTALSTLEKKWKCIESEKVLNDKGECETTIYRVKFKSSEVVGKSNHPGLLGDRKIQPPVVGKSNYGSGKIQPPVVGKSNPQERARQETGLQQTVKQGGGTPAPAAPLVQSSSLSLYEKMTEEERAFWGMWSKRFPTAPKLTEKAFEAVKKLALHIQNEVELNNLFDYSRKRLEAWKGVGNIGAINLTNLANYLNDWSQQKPAPAPIVEEEKKIDPNSKVFWARNYRNLRGELANSFWMFEEIRFGDLDAQNQQLYLENGPIAEGQKAKIDLFKKRWQNGESLPASINPPPCPVAV